MSSIRIIPSSYIPDPQSKGLYVSLPYDRMETEENLTVWHRSGAMTWGELGILPCRRMARFLGYDATVAWSPIRSSACWSRPAIRVLTTLFLPSEERLKW